MRDLTEEKGTKVGSSFFYWAYSATFLADGFSLVLLPLLALGLTESPLLVSAVFFARTIPWLICSIHAGQFIDNKGASTVFKYAQSVRFLTLIVLAFLILGLDYLGYPILLLCAFIIGVCEVYSDNSSQTLLPSLVEKEELGRANSRLQTLETALSFFIGPSLAVIIFTNDLGYGVITTGVLYLLALIVFHVQLLDMEKENISPSTEKQDKWTGASIVVRSTVLRNMAMTTCISNAVLSGFVAVQPLLLTQLLNLPNAYIGYMYTVYAVGFAVSSYYAPRLPAYFELSSILRCVIVVFPIPFFLISFWPSLYSLIAVVIILGLLNAIWGCLTITYRQQNTPKNVLGRVNAFYRMVSWGTLPLGSILAGLVAEYGSFQTLYFCFGIFLLSLYGVCRTLNAEIFRKDRKFLSKCNLLN